MHKELRKYFNKTIILLVVYFLSFALSFMLVSKLTIIEPKPLTELYSLQNAKPATIFGGIALTNIGGALIMTALGIFFGISAISYTITSGIIFGSVFFKTLKVTTIMGAFTAYGPHALFEIPALILSMAIGLSLGSIVVKEYNKKYKNNKAMKITQIVILSLAAIALIMPSKYLLGNPRIAKALLLMPLFWLTAKTAKETNLFEGKEWKQEVSRGIRLFIKVIIPLYLIAALIEIR
ncbi:MAG: stage II sporulation protein M [Nanoarchaeota archaeon]